jgi:hypothetical protein
LIPSYTDRVVVTGGVTERAEFGISDNDTAHIMHILRKQVYTDKVLAVLREYGANAWDAHRMFGKGDKPIRVTLPTASDPTLSIRDYGPGLSPQDIIKVYTKYGASTKRNGNAAVGMLGIGSKSAFAYTDSFMIISYHAGMKHVYSAVLDESNRGAINLLHSEECGEETGVDIRVAVRNADIDEFTRKARTVFQYFDPLPVGNIEFPPLPPQRIQLKTGALFDDEETIKYRVSHYGDTAEWVGVMGCVGYRINVSQVSDQLPKFITRSRGILRFDIGEVDVSASREELEYSDRTKKMLLQRFNDLVDEYVERTLVMLNKPDVLPWQKRLHAQIFHTLGLPVPETHVTYVAARVPLNPHGEGNYNETVPERSFEIRQSHHDYVANTLNVNPTVRLIIRDEAKRKLEGYNLRYYDDFVIVKKNPDTDWTVVLADLDKFLEEKGLTGIPIRKISELTWNEPYRRRRGGPGRTADTKKHRQASFTLKTGTRFTSKTLSSNWEIAEQEPTADSVFVILSSFESQNGFDIYDEYRSDQEIANLVRREMPVIYGYKSTTAKPLTPENCTGIHYPDWQREFNRSLLTAELKDMYRELQWQNIVNTFTYTVHHDQLLYHKVKTNLGVSDHEILTFVRRHLHAKKYVHRNPRARDWCAKLRDRISQFYDTEVTEPRDALSAIETRYPLFKHYSLRSLWGVEGTEWGQYINALDNFTKEIKCP